MDTKSLSWGNFEVPMVRGPAVVVDCSGWDTLGEEITYGSFVTDVVRGPAIVQTPEYPKLQLAFGVEAGGSADSVEAKVGRIVSLLKDYGCTWDRTPSQGEPGRITVQFVPTTEEAAGRLAWLKETLTPVLADIREVTKPEWSEIPAWV